MATFYAEPLLAFDLDIILLLPETSGGLLTLTTLYETLRGLGHQEDNECVLIEGVPPWSSIDTNWKEGAPSC